MKSKTEDILFEFLEETENFFCMLDSVQFETIVELYQMYVVCAKTSCEHIQDINTEIRVEIGKRLDLLLDHIATVKGGDIKAEVNIYTPAIQGYRNWKNVELMKDKGLVGYMLSKQLGGKAIMYYCSNSIDYTYASELTELELIYTGSKVNDYKTYYNFLRENYNKMDILILHGMYNETIWYLDCYRKFRPDGKVYCGLDMNRYWMKNINWSSKDIKNFAQQCDIIATSCTSLRDQLNRNPDVPFVCHYIPNGFYNSSIEVIADETIKENVIITVGRIGTQQKNNIELMRAFSKILYFLPNWKLKFIGPIEDEFRPVITEYFKLNPDLSKQVFFTEAITDKKLLYEEYAKAKVFALTSILEGGTPNVYAEALFHGCMFLTSAIDAANDITDFGRLGVTYELGNIEQLSKALLYICNKAEEPDYQKHIKRAKVYAKKHYDWESNAKKLAYALFPL